MGIRVEVGTMITKTRVRRATGNKDIISTITRERGLIRQQGILANKPQRTTVLHIQLMQSVGKFTQGNADKGQPYVTSAVRKGIMLEGVRLRHQVTIGRTRIRDHNLDH